MKVVSLFSGAGGLDLGFKMAGHDIIWANDMYADAVETYKKNIGDHIICEDISKIKAEDIPDCDIIIGGFPCQGFSVANTKRHEDDERNVLYKQLIRMIDAKRPKFFLAENVKGITNLAKGKVFQMILKDFTELGYKVKHKILNAADYGVPQTRQVERKRVQSSRVYRPNQAAFRKSVLRACERCIITNVTMPEVLEAAHIKPFKYKGEDTVANGFAMRTDIHTLFDTGHLRISPEGVIELSSRARMDYGASIPPRIVVPDFTNKDFLRWRYENYNGI